MFNEDSDYLSLDFETTEVSFFDKKKRKSLDWTGHPRLAQATIVSFKNDLNCIATEDLQSVPTSNFCTLIFHNASFDIQVGLNMGAWNESQFC